MKRIPEPKACAEEIWGRIALSVSLQKMSSELWQEVGKNEVRIQQLEEELRNLRPSCPAAASRVSEGATATPFEVAVSR